MYDFIKSMYLQGKVTMEQVRIFVEQGRITDEQAQEILGSETL